MTPTARDGESGFILINVLSVVALCSVAMLTILTLQDQQLDRRQLYQDAARAREAALGAELSAVSALSRDLIQAPQSDHYAEAWKRVSDDVRKIEGGAFTLQIIDEQARYNLNNLLIDGVEGEGLVTALLAHLKAPKGLTADAIAGLVRARRGISSLSDLGALGQSPGTLARLSEVFCVLPTPTDVNLNTAGEPLLAAILGNPVSARLLAARRDKRGFLTTADLASSRVIQPVRSGFRSDYFLARSDVRIGSAAFALESHIRRTPLEPEAPIRIWRRVRIAPDAHESAEENPAPVGGAGASL